MPLTFQWPACCGVVYVEPCFFDIEVVCAAEDARHRGWIDAGESTGGKAAGWLVLYTAFK